MQSKLFLAVAGAALAVGTMSSPLHAQWAPEGYGHADAFAQGLRDKEITVDYLSPFSHEASAVHNPSNATPPNAAASARSYGGAFGPFGVYASFAGHADNPDGADMVEASASAANWVFYRVTSPTLPDGAPVTARLTLNFDGRIDAYNGSGGQLKGPQLYASIYTDTQLGQNGKVMDVIHEGGMQIHADGPFAHDDFQHDAVLTNDGAGTMSAQIRFTDTVVFQTNVGSLLEFSFNLWGDGSLDYPLSSWATVDFTNGSTYSLAIADPGSDARLVVVPEPASLSLLGLGALATLRRRRRAL